MHRIVTRQMSVGFGVPQVVDRDDFDLVFALPLIQRAQHVPADTPISIDADFDCHHLVLFELYFANTFSMASTTLSGVKPYALNKSFAGAEAPK